MKPSLRPWLTCRRWTTPKPGASSISSTFGGTEQPSELRGVCVESWGMVAAKLLSTLNAIWFQLLFAKQRHTSPIAFEGLLAQVIESAEIELSGAIARLEVQNPAEGHRRQFEMAALVGAQGLGERFAPFPRRLRRFGQADDLEDLDRFVEPFQREQAEPTHHEAVADRRARLPADEAVGADEFVQAFQA